MLAMTGGTEQELTIVIKHELLRGKDRQETEKMFKKLGDIFEKNTLRRTLEEVKEDYATCCKREHIEDVTKKE